MSRLLTPAAVGALMDSERTALFLIALHIQHGTTNIYVVNNRETVTYDGNDYLAYPFDVTLPRESSDRPPDVTLTIENVDRLLISTIRTINTPPTVSLSVLLNDTPPSLEIGPLNFTVRTVEYNAAFITARMTYLAVLDEPFPAGIMTPNNYPGIFGGVPESTTWDPEGEAGAAAALPSFGEPAYTGYGKRRRRRN